MHSSILSPLMIKNCLILFYHFRCKIRNIIPRKVQKRLDWNSLRNSGIFLSLLIFLVNIFPKNAQRLKNSSSLTSFVIKIRNISLKNSKMNPSEKMYKKRTKSSRKFPNIPIFSQNTQYFPQNCSRIKPTPTKCPENDNILSEIPIISSSSIFTQNNLQ